MNVGTTRYAIDRVQILDMRAPTSDALFVLDTRASTRSFDTIKAVVYATRADRLVVDFDDDTRVTLRHVRDDDDGTETFAIIDGTRVVVSSVETHRRASFMYTYTMRNACRSFVTRA